MRRVSNIDSVFNGDKFSAELRGQPRKSDVHWQKHGFHHDEVADDNDDVRHHRNGPAKNNVRVQLRRIQQLFN